MIEISQYNSEPWTKRDGKLATVNLHLRENVYLFSLPLQIICLWQVITTTLIRKAIVVKKPV